MRPRRNMNGTGPTLVKPDGIPPPPPPPLRRRPFPASRRRLHPRQHEAAPPLRAAPLPAAGRLRRTTKRQAGQDEPDVNPTRPLPYCALSTESTPPCDVFGVRCIG